jgi:hypothetical protein
LNFINIIPLALVEKYFNKKNPPKRQLSNKKDELKKVKKTRKRLAKVLRELGPNAKDSNGKFVFQITYVSILLKVHLLTFQSFQLLRETIIDVPLGRDETITLYLRLCEDRMKKYPNQPKKFIIKVGQTTMTLRERDNQNKPDFLKGSAIIPVETLIGYTEE